MRLRVCLWKFFPEAGGCHGGSVALGDGLWLGTTAECSLTRLFFGLRPQFIRPIAPLSTVAKATHAA